METELRSEIERVYSQLRLQLEDAKNHDDGTERTAYERGQRSAFLTACELLRGLRGVKSN